MAELVARHLADVVDTIPYLLGYYPAEDQVAVVTRYGDLVGPVFGITPGQTRTTAEHAVAPILERQRDRTATSWIVIGYGPSGPQRAQTVGDLISDATGRPATLLASDQGLVWGSPPGVQQWKLAATHDTAYVAAAFATAGRPAPAGSRAEALAGYERYGQPTWQPAGAADTARIFEQLPTTRLEQASSLLDDASRAFQSDRAAARWDPTQAGHFAALAGSHDALPAALIGRDLTEWHVDALVGLYRGAPAAELDTAAVVAGAAVYFHRGNATASRLIIDQVAQTSPHRLLADITTVCAYQGRDPVLLRTQLFAGTASDLEQADAEHTTRQFDQLLARLDGPLHRHPDPPDARPERGPIR